MASTTPIYEIVLQPSDVPGAIFDYSDVQQHSVLQMKRWLECRGLPVSGSKSELVDRCNLCISNGSDGNIIISIDNGKWYEKKVQGLLALLKSSKVNTPARLRSQVGNSSHQATYLLDLPTGTSITTSLLQPG